VDGLSLEARGRSLSLSLSRSLSFFERFSPRSRERIINLSLPAVLSRSLSPRSRWRERELHYINKAVKCLLVPAGAQLEFT